VCGEAVTSGSPAYARDAFCSCKSGATRRVFGKGITRELTRSLSTLDEHADCLEQMLDPDQKYGEDNDSGPRDRQPNRQALLVV
jgi:hypothetical protein